MQKEVISSKRNYDLKLIKSNNWKLRFDFILVGIACRFFVCVVDICNIYVIARKTSMRARASIYHRPRRKRRDETEYECRASAFRGPRYFRNFPIPPLTLSTFLRRPLSVPPLSTVSTISFSHSLGRRWDSHTEDSHEGHNVSSHAKKEICQSWYAFLK